MTEPPPRNRRIVLASRPRDLPAAENFSLETTAVPRPRDGEVLVRIQMAALSPWQGQRLKAFENFAAPFALGDLIDCDVIGEVVESRTAALAVGARVAGRLGWQDYAVARPSALEVVDEEIPPAIWLTALHSPGLTAYVALSAHAPMMPGATMVVTSAAGAVGSFALQLGRLAGMRTVGIAGGPAKCAVVGEQLGADAALDYRADNFLEALADACSGGVAVFFDTVGGSVADAVFDHLARQASVLLVGRSASNNSPDPSHDPANLRQVWSREATVYGFSRYAYPERWGPARAAMSALYREGKLTVLHNVVHGFERAPLALGDMLAGHYVGKVLVDYARPESSR